MKTNRGLHVATATLMLVLLGTSSLWTQNESEIPGSSIEPTISPAMTESKPSFYKRKAEWRKIIDEYWGPGLPYQQKLQVFNTFADFVQTKFSAFNGLGINWDSLRTYYRNQITDSTSHGRFSGIMNALAYSLREAHTIVLDSTYFKVDMAAGRVIYPPWGTPVLVMYGVDANHFGATLSPLPDSSLLVIRTIPNHPLGLVPGDVVLGYEGSPWRYLWKELLAMEMPSFLLFGGSWSSQEHLWLAAAGMNWHLFDTIDVVKYPTGDTLHLPVDTLKTLNVSQLVYNNQSLAIAGVPEPDYKHPFYFNTRPVTYGRVQGTNVGYVYVTAHTKPATRDEFVRAVDALWDTDGMIIDIRHDTGGETLYHLGQGLAKMMNFKTYTFDMYRRASASDYFALAKFLPPPGSAGGKDWYIDADPETVYDRPVAVLVGPVCASMGDVSAYMLKHVPNARFFGKPTRGCMAGHWDEELLRNLFGFDMDVSDVICMDYYSPPRMLERADFPVDEEVWLTQEDVVKGEDTVVKRALAWIRSVAHAHDVVASARFCKPGSDTIQVTTHAENPSDHLISLMAYFEADSIAVDSAAFADDGLHGDGASGDGVWGTSWSVPAGERFYNVGFRVADPTDPSTYPLPYAARFTTAGPLMFAGYTFSTSDTVAGPGKTMSYQVALRNRGTTATVPNVTARVRSLDTTVLVQNVELGYGDLSAGQSSAGTVAQRVRYSTSRPGNYVVQFVVDISSNEVLYWNDTFADLVTGVGQPEQVLPKVFALDQNYPNPFNPSTTIRYGLPNRATVRLTVFNTLGQQVILLQNGEQDAGYHEVKFDASGLSSGVYFYRLRAENFVSTKKMLILR